jgi:S1-C subfamily serine protease
MAEQETNRLMALSDGMANAVEQAAGYTVLVNGRERLPSSGVAYSSDMILTADHALEREDEIQIILPDGSELSAQVAGRDPGTDLAVLRTEKTGLLPATRVEQPARVGQLVLAVGRPTSEGIQASLGVVSAVAGPVRTWRGGLLENYLRTDAIPYPGFSGGPLINVSGEMVGINTSGLSRGSSVAIPVGIAWGVAANLAEHGSLKRGYLGIRSQLVELSPEMQAALGRHQASGLLVIGVESASPASQGGLLVGDILVGLNGEAVAEHEELLARLAGEVVGKAAQIEVVRGGKPQVFTVNVGELPQQTPRRGGRRWRR